MSRRPQIERGDDAWDVISTKDFDAVITLKEPDDVHVWGGNGVDPDLLADVLEDIARNLRALKRNGTL